MTMRSILAREALFSSDPDDELGPEFSRVRHIKSARKSHPCSHCDGGMIPTGQPYVEYVEIEAGRFSRRTYCAGTVPCSALASRLAGRKS